MTNNYDEPKDINKKEFIDILGDGDITQICDSIVRAVHFINDYDWLLQQYVSLIKHSDVEVRGVTIACLGHLARLNENADKAQLLEILEPLITDKELSGRVEDAIDDVNTFL